MQRLQSIDLGLTENQKKLAIIGGATLGALYLAKKLILPGQSKSCRYVPEEPDEDLTHLPEIKMPGIVSDIDGVVIKGKSGIPRAKETLERLLTPYSDTKRKVPFIFLSNGGACSEEFKAQAINQRVKLGQPGWLKWMIGMSGSGPKLTGKDVILCHTILKDKKFLDKYKDEWILVDGYANDDAQLLMNLGYTKVVTVMELLCLSLTVSPWIPIDV